MQFYLKRESPIPLYYQLVETLRDRIEAGELQPGQQVPPERELSEQAGVSRMTARQAVAYLIREGVLVTRPGIGTFVVQPKLTHDPLHLLSFSEEMTRLGAPVSSRVLEQSVVVPSLHVAAGLNLAPGDTAIKLVRLRLSGETPLLLETSFVSSRLCAGLEKQDLMSNSLYHLLEQSYGLRLGRSRQTLEAITANEYEANLFGVGPLSPMILLEGVTYSTQERPVEFFKAVYRGDRFRFVLESHRNGGGLLVGPSVSVALGLKP
jgi:GntR family transcriptional regulator